MSYKSGFIAIIGSPNVGKSTLMNLLVGQKVSIVSVRAQTTRNRVMGVVTRTGLQMVFLDTPGVAAPRNRLGQYMLNVAYEALDEVECILFVADATSGIRARDEALLEKLSEAKAPVVAAINKADAATPEAIEAAREKLARAGFIKNVVVISARTGENAEELVKVLSSYLEEGPQYFPEDMVTDQPERVLVAEIVREKALELLNEEVPHGIGVGVDKIEAREGGKLTDVYATIYCEREGHKGIIIGKQGAMLKKIGGLARRDIEWLLGVRVNLQLWVKVKDDWRNRESVLKELGYE
ncbi:MAG TPA: GTPase Era [Clostridia bacterium]|nr:GTPase Era [Clostridia bacterium]